MIKDILYKELSYKVVGCFYEVYNELGPAHKELVYHEALKIAFNQKRISYQSKPRITVKFQNRPVGVYEPDFIVDNKSIVEIKSSLTLPRVFEKQLYYYLKGTEFKVGYLVNFSGEKIDIRRRVFDTARINANDRKFA